MFQFKIKSSFENSINGKMIILGGLVATSCLPSATFHDVHGVPNCLPRVAVAPASTWCVDGGTIGFLTIDIPRRHEARLRAKVEVLYGLYMEKYPKLSLGLRLCIRLGTNESSAALGL